ncbi:MAG: hypothetical protein J7623_30475 [Chitinophaga sp.]|uniref:hypothetical protein n=1 Tax=Chitinophaga sp. TaxID=1869181 RepID=UPI001B2D288F|nr:hypothetical protein [Chitinophaga sp.]MBO9733007.1 hypothetical protein [Chitinophaga sp.]
MKIATFEMRRFLLIPVTCLLMVLMAMSTTQVNAQTIKLPSDLSVGNDPKQGTSTSTGSTLFCAAASGFTLKSTTADNSVTPAVNYTSWAWSELDPAGTAGALPAGTATATNEKLVVTSATPGWHTYQVIASTGTAGCPADPVLFTVFVLPDLSITSSIDPSTPSLTYCAASGAPTGANAITLKSAVSFATALRTITGLRSLAVTNFDLTYVWTKEDLATGTKTTVGTNAATYTVDDAASSTGGAEKKYKYSVQVAYTMKTCGTYTATTQYNSTDATITVTPKPGAPTITIE